MMNTELIRGLLKLLVGACEIFIWGWKLVGEVLSCQIWYRVDQALQKKKIEKSRA